MTKNRLRDMLADAAEAAWRNGSLPDAVDSKAWDKMTDDEVVIVWLSSVKSSLGSAQDLLEAEVENEAGRGDESAWRADLLHVAALEVFIDSLIKVKTSRVASRPCKGVDELIKGLAPALKAARDRYMRGSGGSQ